MKYCHSSCIVPPTNLPKMFAFEPAVRDDTKLLVQFQLNRIALIFTPEKSLRGEWGGWAKNANNIWQSYTLSPKDRRQLEAKKRIAVPPFQYFWRFKRKNTVFVFFVEPKRLKSEREPCKYKNIWLLGSGLCFENKLQKKPSIVFPFWEFQSSSKKI